jgi:molecular chaperone DnaK (HSP70)
MTIVGIDPGTTNSAIGYMAAEGPRLISNASGDPLLAAIAGT